MKRKKEARGEEGTPPKKRDTGVSKALTDMPSEVIEVVFVEVGLKECLRSADLVCRAWHELVHSCDRLWSIFFRQEIVTLTNPDPYPLSDGCATDTSWRGKCLRTIRDCNESYLPLDWAIYHGFLGLAKKMLIARRVCSISDTERVEIYMHNCMKGTSGSTPEENINCVRCLVAMGAPLDGDASEWANGNWLHFSCYSLQLPLLTYMLKEFCAPIKDSPPGQEDGGGGGGRNTARRLDVNKKSPADGLTPLHCVFESASSDEEVEALVQALIEYGADPSITDARGLNVPAYAAQRGTFPRTLSFLQQIV